MTSDIENDVQERIKALYREDDTARDFLDQCAERAKDASSISIDRMAYLLDSSRQTAIELARELEEAGVGTFMVGRRGHKSRFEWEYSCISVGKVAAGETTALEEPEDAEEEIDDAPAPNEQGGSLTIAQAKEQLSRSLGVPIDAIQISIQA